MAVFLGNIKGLSSNATSANYTYIVFGSNTTPTLYTSTTNHHSVNELESDINATNWGNLIVSDSEDVQEVSNFTFSSFDDNKITYEDSTFTTTGVTLQGTTASDLAIKNANLSNINIISGTATLSDLTAGSATFASATLNGDLKAGTNTIINSTYIQAPYFNATSDKNLKTNIQELLPTLDMVREVPVYSFNYTDTDLPSIGIMAQDVEKYKFDNFSLVDNSGEHLTIHESKLVYILWKAVQELQEELSDFKQRFDMYVEDKDKEVEE